MSVEDLIRFRNSPEGKKLASWAKTQFNSAREARTEIQHTWYRNIAMVWGQQHLKDVVIQGSKRIQPAPAPRYVRRKTRNILRPFVRRESSKFLSSFPNVVCVPSTAEDEDVRAAYAAEQAWTSMSETRGLQRVWARVVFWMVVTGNGFVKQWWDPTCEVPGPEKGQVSRGDIKFEVVSPFHLFVPDLMERELDDQPLVIQAQTKTMQWAKTWYKDELNGVDLNGSQPGGTDGVLDTQFRSVTGTSDNKSDKVTVYEYWVKRGATELLPDGGLIVMVDETMVAYSEGFPYKHGQFPFSKVEHIPSETFYGISPLIDLIELQKDYNEQLTDVFTAAKRMGRPQLIAFEGSIVTSKMTNEPGSIIGVRPGFTPPTPLPLANIPQYVSENIERTRADFDDISGQHEVSMGEAPTGVSAGTALAFLKENDDSYLTVQYQNLEQAVERTAQQTLSLFNEFVDTPRKLRVVGKDASFDVLMLSGSDISSGLDVRVEQGSSIGESRAAKEARLLEQYQNGLITQADYFRLAERGGPLNTLDTLQIAARKAQRENLKMKSLKPELLLEQQRPFIENILDRVTADPAMMAQLQAEGRAPEDIIEEIQLGAPAAVPVDDFDLHEVHLEEHNRFRMSQEYEQLPDAIKQEFQKHVAEHEQYLQQMMAMQMMMQAGGGDMGALGGTPGGESEAGGENPGPEPMPDTMGAEPITA